MQEIPFTKGKRPLRGRGRGSGSPPLHPLKNPHNPPERVLNRRTPVRLSLSPSARCAEGRRSIKKFRLRFSYWHSPVRNASPVKKRKVCFVFLCTRSIANSSTPICHAKHKSFDRPAASAQRADAVLPYPTGVRRLSTLLMGPVESGSEASFPWDKAEQRSGLHLPQAEDCSPRSL